MRLLYYIFCIIFLTFCGTYEPPIEGDFQNSPVNKISVEIVVENIPETVPASQTDNPPFENVPLPEEPSDFLQGPSYSETEDSFYEDILFYESLSWFAQGPPEPSVKEDSQSSGSSEIVRKDVEEEPPLPETEDPSTEIVLLHAKPLEFAQIPQEVEPAFPQEVEPTSPQEVEPAFPQEVEPLFAQKVEPTFPQEVEPLFAQKVEPTFPQEVEPIFPPEEKPTLLSKKEGLVVKPVQENLSPSDTDKPSIAMSEKPVQAIPPSSGIKEPAIENVISYAALPKSVQELQEEPPLSQAERLAHINSVLDESLVIFDQCKFPKNYILFIDWDIDENGHPQNITIENPSREKSLMDCVTNEIKKLEFSKSLQGPIRIRLSLFTGKHREA